MVGYVRAVWGRIASDLREYGMAGVALLLYTAAVNLVFHAFCPLVIFSGIPCPGCGVTRAAVCLMTGRWQQAWRMNPVIFPIALAAVWFAWRRYLLGREVKGIKGMLALIAALLVIVYILRMYLYFPDRAPYVYTPDNVLARLYSFIA